jgi:hypothetical protein
MTKNKTSKLEIDYDVADGITLLNLVNAYKLMKEETKKLKSLEHLQSHQAADLEYNRKMLKHLEQVIKYYGDDV